MARPLLIGNGAGFSGDRLDVALPVVRTLIARGGPAAMTFETLAERTLALGVLARRGNDDAGYEPMLLPLLRPVLGPCLGHGIPIIGNFGAANPRGAAAAIARLASELGLRTPRIAVLEGDDVRAVLDEPSVLWPEGRPTGEIVAANAYLGAFPIAEALADGAEIVVTGRIADPALALGPLIHHFGWAAGEHDRLASGTLAGHLLECGAQVTGGYFADPGVKDVPGTERLGFPIAEVTEDGVITVTKADDTGGLVDRRTVTEQILYEIHDPAAYLTPDVTLDVTEVRVAELGSDQVRVTGARGRPAPDTLKATVSLSGGFLAEGEISYAGPNAGARARLASDTLRKRLAPAGNSVRSRIDILGLQAVFDSDDAARGARAVEDGEFRVRLAAASPDRAAAEEAAREVLHLYCTGPAGGGGVRVSVTPRIATTSALIPRSLVTPRVSLLP
ncbi:acyclic terpene utilization AtuA family protein [Elioraea rosea]|uniref:acyclic terpene utilization AtuA family protein n=1 Tax=Elioraea rosea TaxID=2492390 RepID=UPI00118298CF|nr:acyclic terpene utilization AtuA family protein [Elioraea rosea]